MVVDHKNKRLMELVEGKSGAELRAALEHIPGRENVQWVTLDMSDSYRSFARSCFPNAQLVADKFHVLRLLTRHPPGATCVESAEGSDRCTACCARTRAP